MAESMVEKVARAICRETMDDPDEIFTRHPPPEGQILPSNREAEEFEYFDPELQETFYSWKRWRSCAKQARAAIEVMRVPTDEMLSAMSELIIGDVEGQNVRLWIDDAREAWQIGIDAALAENADG